MKYKPAFKKDVQNIILFLRREFYVGEYKLSIVYTDEDDISENKTTLATIHIDNTYLRLNITLYPELQKKYEADKNVFFEVLVHEFCHVLTEPLYDIAIQAISKREQDFLEEIRERQTQRISNILTDYLQTKYIKHATTIPVQKQIRNNSRVRRKRK